LVLLQLLVFKGLARGEGHAPLEAEFGAPLCVCLEQKLLLCSGEISKVFLLE